MRGEAAEAARDGVPVQGYQFLPVGRDWAAGQPQAVGGVRGAGGLSAVENGGYGGAAAVLEAGAGCANRGGERETFPWSGARSDCAAHGRRRGPRGVVYDGGGPGALFADAAQQGHTGRGAHL